MSTLRFDVGVPVRNWSRIWLGIVIVCVCIVVGLEVTWRRLGHHPGLEGNSDLWSLHRERAVTAGDRALAVVGDSQIQIGFDQDVARQAHPELEIAQLAVCGHGGAFTIADLASDPEFTGRVIWSINESVLHPDRYAEQQSFVRRYRNEWDRRRKWSYLLKRPLEERFVLAGPDVSLMSILDYAARGVLPSVNAENEWAGFHRDRSRNFFMTPERRIGLDRYRADEVEEMLVTWPPSEPDVWLETIAWVNAWLDAFAARGVKVALVKMPSSGPWLDRWTCEYPQFEYWDVLKAAVDVPAIRMYELPGMSRIECIDEIHLAPEEARIATGLLLQELEDQDFFR